MTATEQVFIRSLLWATAGIACAVPVLVLPQPGDPLLTMTVQLAVVVLFGIGLAFHLAPLADVPWFDDLEMGTGGRRALTWVVVSFQVAAVAGITMVATAAAFRYAPSVQFLLVLSALGIVAAASVAVLGARRRFGATTATWTAIAVGAVGVWAIWAYASAVGFTPEGDWIVDGEEIMRRIVLPDLARWLLAFVVFSMGVRSARS